MSDASPLCSVVRADLTPKVRFSPPKCTFLGAVSGAGRASERCVLGCGMGAEWVCAITPIPPMPSAPLKDALAYPPPGQLFESHP